MIAGVIRAGTAACLLTISACGTISFQSADGTPSQPRSIPTDAAWIRVPADSLVTARSGPGLHEQRALLPNSSGQPGENTIFMRAVLPFAGSDSIPRFDLQALLSAAGGMPSPFTEASLTTLRSAEDAAGTVSWTVQTDGAGTFCVLAMRRLDGALRMLPGDARAVNLLMRNCVTGTEAEALEPIRADRVRFGSAAAEAESGEVRGLSPLAAPLP